MNPNIWGPHLWLFIHTLCLDYSDNPSEQQKKDIINFFMNLGNIIPCEQCSDHYNQNLSKISDIKTAVNNSTSLFNWSVQLHNSVNRMLRKPEWNVNDAYNYYKSIFEGRTMYSYNTLRNFSSSCPQLHSNLHSKSLGIFKRIFPGNSFLYLLIGLGVGYYICSSKSNKSYKKKFRRN
jgi:hypothetical protein